MTARQTLLAIGCCCLALPASPQIRLNVAPAAGGAARKADDAPARGEDVIRFVNQDCLHGRLLRLDPGAHGLQWQHPRVEPAIKFAAAGVDRIELGARGRRPDQDTPAVIRLTNGDVLTGTIAALDDKHLALDTWYAGRLRIPRNMLRGITPPPSPIYAGPNNLAEWNFNQPTNQPPAWEFKDGRLQARGQVPAGMFLDVFGDLPPRLEFQFDAAWSGLPFFAFSVYASDPLKPENCYRLDVQGPRLIMQRVAAQPANLGAPATHPPFETPDLKRQANFRLRVDRAGRTFELLINGQAAGRWTESAAFQGRGKGLTFLPGKDSALAISNLRVAEWGGGQADHDPDQRDDLVRFINLDTLSGRVLGIADGQLRFQGAYTTFNVPMVRVREIVLVSGARAASSPDDIRAVFADLGTLTFRPLRIEQDRVQAASENFGQATLPLSAFQRLEFKPTGTDTPVD